MGNSQSHVSCLPRWTDSFSAGIFFDLIECLIQRDFGYNTRDVRQAYELIRLALLDKDITKVVVVVHSQGGIVMSMALDNLLGDLPRECASYFNSSNGKIYQ